MDIYIDFMYCTVLYCRYEEEARAKAAAHDALLAADRRAHANQVSIYFIILFICLSSYLYYLYPVERPGGGEDPAGAGGQGQEDRRAGGKEKSINQSIDQSINQSIK